jgi:hypothetical protein
MRKYRISVANPKGRGAGAAAVAVGKPGAQMDFAGRPKRRTARLATGSISALRRPVILRSRSGGAFPLILSETTRKYRHFTSAGPKKTAVSF